MKKSIAATVLCFALFPAAAQAQVNFGIRMATSSALGNAGPTSSQGGYFGLNVGTRTVVLGGFDFSRFEVESEERSAMSAFTPYAGVKYFMRDRYYGVITPYVRGDVFKAITRWPNLGDSALQLVSGLLGPSSVTMTKAETEEFLKEILSPWGFNIAFGAEYFLADMFSVGGEFGLRSGFSKARVDVSQTGQTTETTLNYQDTYIAVTLNFIL
jgi:opacity protein-like surface antigen